MAVRSRHGRCLLQLVQRQLLALGQDTMSNQPCIQHIRNGVCREQCRFYHSSAASLRQAAACRQQFSQQARRGVATASPSGSNSRGPVSFASLALTAATGAGLMLYYNHMMEQKLKKASGPKEAAAGKPMVGGPFELIDQHGRPFTDRDLLGKWALLYFGFTFCPDICPDELDKMAEAVNAIENESGAQVQPVFITLDPERDSVKQVHEYVREFHPRLIGLTGPKEKTDAAAKAYRVYHMKTDETEDYLVDHSIIMYLLNPRGEFVQFYGKNIDAPAMSKAIQGHIAEFKSE